MVDYCLGWVGPLQAHAQVLCTHKLEQDHR